MRYTPAGIPALNLLLEHTSQVVDAENPRQVTLVLKAVAFGTSAERLAVQAIGSVWKFKGFLANSSKGKSVVLHIQNFLPE